MGCEAVQRRFTSTHRVVTTVYICKKTAQSIRVDAGSMPSARGNRRFFLLAQIKVYLEMLLSEKVTCRFIANQKLLTRETPMVVY